MNWVKFLVSKRAFLLNSVLIKRRNVGRREFARICHYFLWLEWNWIDWIHFKSFHIQKFICIAITHGGTFSTHSFRNPWGDQFPIPVTITTSTTKSKKRREKAVAAEAGEPRKWKRRREFPPYVLLWIIFCCCGWTKPLQRTRKIPIKKKGIELHQELIAAIHNWWKSEGHRKWM